MLRWRLLAPPAPGERPSHRRAVHFATRNQQVRACHEDDVLCWWLLRLRVQALCLYRCLVMLDRLSRLPRIETLEFVIGAQRAGGGLDAHAWTVANGRIFRQGGGDVGELGVLCRFSRHLTPAGWESRRAS